MKLYLKNYFHEEMEDRAIEDFRGDEEKGKLDHAQYISYAYKDYMKYHADGVNTFNWYGDYLGHDELCSWCNYHATIRDICAGVVDYQTCEAVKGADSCQTCLSKTTWYKKL